MSKFQDEGKQSLPAESGIQWNPNLLLHERYNYGTLSWRWMDTGHEDWRKEVDL